MIHVIDKLLKVSHPPRGQNDDTIRFGRSITYSEDLNSIVTVKSNVILYFGLFILNCYRLYTVFYYLYLFNGKYVYIKRKKSFVVLCVHN